ncbi:efflux transporter outer membrane subunit [Chitiniphilus eburneus]|uniref:Efflux transporter outer membrane subunit n=1 Tax=Chitiniphilus eburneus TaxID=2571148 RepID=A0A4U0PCZ5_9NEIS|nr:efflux transporter outer membrane subunit [Chitiniphilus eburneus]TJZ65623.1 efflux transporter outer membrane subunit [Chitiniphilus eburneus]
MNRPRIALRGSVLALLLALNGCALLSPDRTPVALDLPEGSQVATIDSQWWHLFGDKELDALVERARERNADAQIAIARIEEARAALGIASAEQLPRLDLGADASRQRVSENGLQRGLRPNPYDSYQFAASASWELDLWGRVRNQREAALAQLQATQYDYESVLLAVSAATVEAYFNLRALDAQVNVAQQTLTTREESYQLRVKRFQGGLTSELDVRQAEAELMDARAALPQLQASQTQAQNILFILSGASPRELYDETAPRGTSIEGLLPGLFTLPAGLPSDLLLRRPDVQSAEQQLRATRAQIQVARAAYFPRITLTGLFGVQSLEFSDLFKGPSKVWGFAGDLTMPLFDNGLTAAQVDQARARDKQAAINYTQTVRSAFGDVRVGLDGVQRSRERAEALKLQSNALARQVRLAQLRYDNGYSDYLEVLDAERSDFQVQLTLITAQRDALVAQLSLIKALGGGWQAPVDTATSNASAPG